MKAWHWVSFASIISGGACALEAAPPRQENPGPIVAQAELPNRDCAGPDGVVCPAGKFCAAAQASRCPDVETTGICRHTPEACVDMYQPVCGCDGQTYGNDCLAATAGAAVAYEGPCAPLCGGFANLPCPGAGTCMDNATDACDPLQGDSDCASLCKCEVLGLCTGNAEWDSSPEVCACVGE